MFRIGFGNDIHRLEEGKKLILGGVEIPSDFGAVGHSDADALVHSVTDAIFGALAFGDIGEHFSDKDDRWKNADSFIFLHEAVKMMKEKGYRVRNLDAVVSLEKPKIRSYIPQMRVNLASALEIDVSQVSIKAKTGEGLDSVGRCMAVKAEAVVLLYKVTDEK
ncbi:MAG: 2-C-methyl-D-erythritol 2,4-cyclodiphosphate synthase [Pyrinomonadaceae bacterium]|nr:2-C-methyl-D-erythritol 2,4-cyclodiphosphate synthase [Pyrinomonadaceae bacterium]MCX7639871.1 2-C-methyl-D-erythritol 2,4-cyclodiphosphate synthase [Pyrinomonadaceae bacterium]MDW8304043.1 2-C-methyl-D-erythritol 2,4-cyclodiphosphate synthase [Acidobacteriota bacterium]